MTKNRQRSRQAVHGRSPQRHFRHLPKSRSYDHRSAVVSAQRTRESPSKSTSRLRQRECPPLNSKRRCDMFRVSYSDSVDGQRWSLYGRLAGPWVDELRSCWKYARDRTPWAHAIVDLKEVTFIDQAGETLLAEMRSAGAELIATGVEHQHLLATLENRLDPSARGTTRGGGNK